MPSMFNDFVVGGYLVKDWLNKVGATATKLLATRVASYAKARLQVASSLFRQTELEVFLVAGAL